MQTAIALRRLPETAEGWLLVLVLVAAVIVIGYFLQKRRREGLRRAAEEMGFSFHPEGEGVTADFHGLPLIQRASELENFLQGSTGSTEVILLDCQVGSGKQAVTQTVACFRRREKALTGFELRPENIFHKIGSAFGYKDIDFDANPQFSKSYLLRGADEAAIRSLFHAGVLGFFEQHKGWCVEGEGSWLAVYRDGRTVSPKKLRTFLEEATQVFTAFAH